MTNAYNAIAICSAALGTVVGVKSSKDGKANAKIVSVRTVDHEARGTTKKELI